MVPTILEIFAFVIAGFFIGFYAFYYLLCLRYSRKKVIAGTNSLPVDYSPNVSFIVPTYNEAKMIEARINNFRKMNYPMEKLEIVFVDSGSEDGTLEKIEASVTNVPCKTKIVEQGCRKGFNAAVIEGFYSTTGDIIFITGAETQYAPDALRIIVNHFADPTVGAVNGTMRVNNGVDRLSTKLETAYRDIYDFIRLAESNMDTLFDIKGEIAASRRSVCQHLVENKEMSREGCIDASVNFQAKKDGYRTVYDPRAVYYEPTPETMRDSFKQQTRRAATLIQNMRVFKSLMFKRKYGLFGMLIMPAHLLMLQILPFLFFLAIGSFIALAVLNPLNFLLIGFLVAALLALFFSRSVQAFAKTQVTLAVACLKMLRGTETQKFERLASVRPDARLLVNAD